MTMTVENLQQAGDTWQQLHLSTVISKSNTVESLNISKYDLKRVKGKIHIMRKVVIPLFVSIMVNSVAKLLTHSKCVNMAIKPIRGYSDHISMARSYGVLRG